MKIALAQVNPTVGDLEGNAARLRKAYDQAVGGGADLVVTPELALCGYPPRDLLLQSDFLERNRVSLDALAGSVGETGFIVGHVSANENHPGRPATNSATLLHQGRVQTTRTKTLLPTYDVFDEDRYFEPAQENNPVPFRGHQLGLTICEDVWNDEGYWRAPRYDRNPVQDLVESGAEIILNLSASPWHLGKERMRREMLGAQAKSIQRPLFYCNATGGNDELIFDGGSLAFGPAGQTWARGKFFGEDCVLVDLDSPIEATPADADDEAMLHDALVMGVRDYLGKCGFNNAVIGLSGGIDSAVTAALAVAALGAENVRGVSMPSQFSSAGSLDDAQALAAHLGIQYDVIPIHSSFDLLKSELAPVFGSCPEDVTEENMQARLRGLILMAVSNKFGSLVLTTGNKSELAVGYCTLYGDMCGGLAVISDVPKTMVYRLAHWINRDDEVIPAATINKPPSAELRPDQKDEDSLPPYDQLDPILQLYVEAGHSAGEIVAAGHDAPTVRRITQLVDQNEYKRRQAAPGLKVTTKAFGVGRRIPVAQRFDDQQ